jgi:hypothetical protein
VARCSSLYRETYSDPTTRPKTCPRYDHLQNDEVSKGIKYDNNIVQNVYIYVCSDVHTSSIASMHFMCSFCQQQKLPLHNFAPSPRTDIFSIHLSLSLNEKHVLLLHHHHKNSL